MAVREAGHEPVRRVLTDVAGREDDALRVVVAEAEDRIREVVRERRIDVQRRQIQVARLDDRPVAAVDLDVGIAGVDDAGGNFSAAVHHFHRIDRAHVLTTPRPLI